MPAHTMGFLPLSKIKQDGGSKVLNLLAIIAKNEASFVYFGVEN